MDRKHFIEIALFTNYYSLEDQKLTFLFVRTLSFKLFTQVKHLVDSFINLCMRGNSVSGLDRGVENVEVQIDIDFYCVLHFPQLG